MKGVIAVANPKGGVGKTTAVTSLAGILVEQEQEVLVVDLDPQAHLTISLGINPLKVRRSIVDVLNEGVDLYLAIRETRLPGMDILPARPELAETLLNLPPDPQKLGRLFFGKVQAAPGIQAAPGVLAAPGIQAAPGILAGAEGNPLQLIPELEIYDYILLDCPPSWNRILFYALQAAHLLLVPVQPEFFAVYNLKYLMAMIQEARKTNPHLSYRLLISLQDPQNEHHTDLVEQIRASFGAAVLDTAITLDPQLPLSAVEGLPVNQFDPQAPSVAQFRALASELMAAPGILAAPGVQAVVHVS